MLIERLAFKVRARRRAIQTDLAPGLSVVSVDDPAVARAFVSALRWTDDFAGVLWADLALVDGSGSRIALALERGADGRILRRATEQSGGALDPIDVPSRHVMAFALPTEGGAARPYPDGRTALLSLPLSEVLPVAETRLCAAIAAMDSMVTRTCTQEDAGSQACDAGRQTHRTRLEALVDQAHSLRARRVALESRLSWLAERVSFIDSRLSYIESFLIACAERDDIQAYIERLKTYFRECSQRLLSAETARAALEEASARRASCPGNDGAFEPAIASEVRSLDGSLRELERKAQDCEARLSRASAWVARLKVEQALVHEKIRSAHGPDRSEHMASQARTLTAIILDKEEALDRVASQIASADRVLMQRRLAERMTIAGAMVAALSLMAIILPANVWPSRAASIPETGVSILLALMAAGLLSTVYGIRRGIEIEGRAEARAALDKERAALARQLAWNRQQLSSMLGGHTLDEYVDDLNERRRLEMRRDAIADEMKEALADSARLHNLADFVRVSAVRARERLAEILRATGFTSASSYLDAYERYRRLDWAFQDALGRLESALGGLTEAGIEMDMEIVAEEIAQAEAGRDALFDARANGRLGELSEEYALKAAERERLTSELAACSLELEHTHSELGAIDLWEAASDAAEAAIDDERAAAQKEAAACARELLQELLDARAPEACMRLAESVSEILRFITEARDASVTCAVEDGKAVFFPEGARRADECMRQQARLAVELAIRESADGRDVVPLVVEHLSPTPILAGLLAALRRVSLTRQVILLASPGALPECAPTDHVVTIA
ncbi:MAG TPA: hypothetical protein PLM74_05400 [Bacillota bacterium]|nr:hypothetical protein [Bacillota bacterium]